LYSFRRQLNALVFATFIGLSIGCDEDEACKVGINAAGTACGAVVGIGGGIATGLACTVGAIFTFGLSCAIAAAVTMGGSLRCSQIDSSNICKCTEQIGFNELLDKLDDMNDGFAKLNDDNLKGRLEANIWFQTLNANDKTILEGNSKHRYLWV
jgi:hypothetical protein